MKQKILIVDDDIITLKILKQCLEEKYYIETENSASSFVEKMDTYEVDLILLDLQMSRVDGLGIYDHIRGNVTLKNKPVVFLSGVVDSAESREVLAKGAAGCIIKSAPREDIIKTVDKIIGDSFLENDFQTILLLMGDMERLKSAREALMNEGYVVKPAVSMVDAIYYLDFHKPDIFVIGRDILGAEAKEIHDIMLGQIRGKNVQTIVMDTTLFTTELIEKIKDI